MDLKFCKKVMRSNLKNFSENVTFLLDYLELLAGSEDVQERNFSYEYWSKIMDLYLCLRKFKNIL